MLAVTLLALKLLSVQEFRVLDNVTQIVFTSGETLALANKHDHYAQFMKLVDQSIKYHSLVGVELSPDGNIDSLVRLEKANPLRLIDQDPDYIKVLFQQRDGVFRLRRDHPQFAELKKTLEDAIQSGQPVLFSSHLPLLELDWIAGIPCASPSIP